MPYNAFTLGHFLRSYNLDDPFLSNEVLCDEMVEMVKTVHHLADCWADMNLPINGFYAGGTLARFESFPELLGMPGRRLGEHSGERILVAWSILRVLVRVANFLKPSI